jgi:hypothetical protein
MTSVANLILSVSILSMATALGACDSGGENTATGGSGPITLGGSSNQGGSGPVGSGGTSGGAAPQGEGAPITIADGWVDIAANDLGIQGAVFAYSDTVSGTGLVSTFVGPTACMKGTAAQVMDPCTIVPPATDCYGTFWGAAIGMNLNQPKDPVTGKGVETPLPYDASKLKGFAFTITGDTVPGPASLRFKVENAKGEFCTPSTQKVKVGANQFLFKDLLAECWHVTDPANATAETAQADLVKISWAVVTSKTATVPFDFCVSDVRGLLKAGGTGAGGSGAGGASSGGAGSGAAGAGTAGAGTAGAGTAGAGTAGAGTAGAGTAGSGTAGSGTAGAGTAGSGTAGAGGTSAGSGGAN